MWTIVGTYSQPLSPPLLTSGRRREKERRRKKSVALFTDHCSWQWAVSRKCSLENNRILPLQPKQHPSTVLCVRVWSLHISGSTERTLCVNVETQNETVTSVMCSLGSPSICLTFTLCFSALASTLSNMGLHYFWMEAGVCVHVCLWVEGKTEAMYLWVSVCRDAGSCDWSLNPFSTNCFIIFTREIVISPNLPFKRKKKKSKISVGF